MSDRIAIDVGGTFTDVVRLDPAGTLRFEKVPTTPSEPTRGVLAAFERAEAPLDDTSMFTHGTTLGLNALLTRTGARTAIVATQGFRDVYLLGRTDRRGQLRHLLPQAEGAGGALRHLRGARADVVRRLGAPALRRRRRRARSPRRSVTAGTTRWRWRSCTPTPTPTTSRRCATCCARSLPTSRCRCRRTSPGSTASTSARAPRCSTPTSSRSSAPTCDALGDRLDESGLRRPVPDDALRRRGDDRGAAPRTQPVNLILSGPAGGVVGAAGLAASHRRTEPDHHRHGWHQPRRLAGGRRRAGAPPGRRSSRGCRSTRRRSTSTRSAPAAVRSPGSTRPAACRSGPQSAGAEPGPASLRRRRRAADVHRRRARDRLPRRGDAARRDARRSTRSSPPRRWRRSASASACRSRSWPRGVLRISTTKITGAVRSITVELGHDPKDFALLAFGGAGGDRRRRRGARARHRPR